MLTFVRQSHGYWHLLTINALERVGLLKQKSSKNKFSMLRYASRVNAFMVGLLTYIYGPHFWGLPYVFPRRVGPAVPLLVTLAVFDAVSPCGSEYVNLRLHADVPQGHQFVRTSILDPPPALWGEGG